jgi:adenine deaminase
MEFLIDVAKGDRPADLLLRGGRVANVFTGEIYPANIAIAGEWIAGVGSDYTEGIETIDVEDLLLAPGLINGHLHLESSLLSPVEYARFASPHGTTTIVLDPHEIANVLGIVGIPATNLETSGASLSSRDIADLLKEPRILGLGEMMNFPGILRQDPEVLKKIRAAQENRRPIDGHAPLLQGKSLNAYVASGIESDHECTLKEEAEEKIRLGMWLMIREGTAAKNLADLLPAVTPQNSRRCLLVLDDLEPADLLKYGEIDHAVRKSIQLGLDPITAIQMATLNPAERFGLYDRGAIAPGRRADIIALSNLKEFNVQQVIKNGKIVAGKGKAHPVHRQHFEEAVLHTIKIKPLGEFSLDIDLIGEEAWVIGLVPNQILTQKLRLKVKKDSRSKVISNPEADILKIAVVERHMASGHIGLGLVRGLGLKRGAMAASVAHDSHNIIVVGVNGGDMKTAVQEIEKMQGGFVVVDDGRIKASLALPVAGLMSLLTAEAVATRMDDLNRAAHEIGAIPENPFLTLSFLALPVIPELKITDQGLVDVSEFRIIPLEAR